MQWQGWQDDTAGAEAGAVRQSAAEAAASVQAGAGRVKQHTDADSPPLPYLGLLQPWSGAGKADPDAEVPSEPIVIPDAEEALGRVAEELRETTQEALPPVLRRELFNDVMISDVLLLALVLAGAVLINLLARRLLARLMPLLTRRVPSETAEDILRWSQQAVSLMLLLIALFLLLSFLPLPAEPVNVRGATWRIYMTLFVVFAGVIGYHLIEVLILLLSRRAPSHDRSTLDQSFAPLLRNIFKAIVAVFVVMAVVQAWGYSAAGLLAGLGIGGLALAFAAQDTVANVFGSFIIYGDRPYRVGDWIKVGEHEGIVEDIGIRSTRVRTFENTRLTVPNRDVTTTTVENFTLRTQRRVRFNLGVLYSTPPEKIEQLRDDMLAMLDEHENVTERLLGVRFYAFGESSLDVMISFCSDLTDYQGYHRVREEVLLWILRYCNDHDIGIAFPTRSIWIEGEPDKKKLDTEAAW